jgi:hypothetical protein
MAGIRTALGCGYQTALAIIDIPTDDTGHDTRPNPGHHDHIAHCVGVAVRSVLTARLTIATRYILRMVVFCQNSGGFYKLFGLCIFAGSDCRMALRRSPDYKSCADPWTPKSAIAGQTLWSMAEIRSQNP